jgi:hypothetical protein
VLAASPFPLGVDGYFYPIQLRSLLAGHGLAYPDFPLTFWLMAPFAALTDPIVGAKLAAAIYGALMAVPMCALWEIGLLFCKWFIEEEEEDEEDEIQAAALAALPASESSAEKA